eukprot:scaffold104160_cov63-Phaeocystis_antarctica.AAC.3
MNSPRRTSEPPTTTSGHPSGEIIEQRLPSPPRLDLLERRADRPRRVDVPGKALVLCGRREQHRTPVLAPRGLSPLGWRAAPGHETELALKRAQDGHWACVAAGTGATAAATGGPRRIRGLP